MLSKYLLVIGILTIMVIALMVTGYKMNEKYEFARAIIGILVLAFLAIAVAVFIVAITIYLS